MKRDRRTSRGFALVLVVLMAAIGTMIVTVMITRMSSERRTLKRITDSYQFRNDVYGSQEIFINWHRARSTVPFTELIAPDGQIFTVRLESGAYFTMSVADGQGALLTDLATLSGQIRDDVVRAIENLRLTVTPERFQQLTRAVGPPSVSIVGVEPDVLRAIVSGLTSPEATELFVAQVQAAKESREGITQVTLNEAATRAGIIGEQRNRLFNLVTTEPEIWTYRIEVFDPSVRRDQAVRGIKGLMQPERRATGGRGSQDLETFLSYRVFLTAEPIRYDDPSEMATAESATRVRTNR